MSQKTINFNIEEISNQSLQEVGSSEGFSNFEVIENSTTIEGGNPVVKIDEEPIEKLEDVKNINIFNMMIVLEKIKKQFLQRREFVQDRVNQLDYEIGQLQIKNAICMDFYEKIKLKQETDTLFNERKKLLLEKQLMKKLDKDNQFTYGMIGMAIQTFKNITQTLDWEEMKL